MKKYFQAPWTLKDLSIIFMTALVFGLIISLSSQQLGLEILLEESQYKSSIIAGIFALQWIIILTPALILTAKKYKLNIKRDFGFKKIGILKNLKLALSGYMLYLAIGFAITMLILYADLKIPGYNIQENILPKFGEETIDLLIAGVLIVIIAPILEEMFFRGMILRTLVNHTSKHTGSILTALIFASFHLQFESFIPIFILGLIMNALVIKSKSIYPSITFHILNNAIAFSLELAILNGSIQIDSML